MFAELSAELEDLLGVSGEHALAEENSEIARFRTMPLQR
jgi:hypothetical protein